MTPPTISVERIGKRYRLGQTIERADLLTEAISGLVARPIRRLRGRPEAAPEEHERDFWALRDVSLEVHDGEVLGVVGRNGAGKTTLLKILSRVTDPTEGTIDLYGRVGSLLEVGTGFHPELTGRENVYLNGAILGMRRAEIARKFDEIVEFAGVEQFLDTPVKRYSSGMYVRLAFAVAAHLEPDILIVDEVLAVGDLAFQRKCIGKMQDVATGGRTVLFVSHQLNMVRRLCDRCIWLDNGTVRMDGPTAEALGAYEASVMEVRTGGPGPTSGAAFRRWRLRPSGQEDTWLNTTGPVELELIVDVQRPVRNAKYGIALWSSDDILVWGTDADGIDLDPGSHQFVHSFPMLPLKPGAYQWQFSLSEDRELVDMWYGVPQMIVATKPLGHTRDEWHGLLNLPSEFTVAVKATHVASDA